jgi:hypothetical protein
MAKCGKVRCRCVNKDSFAKVYTSDINSAKVLHTLPNHHHSEDLNISRQAVSNSAKKREQEDLYERPSKIIHRE